MYFQIFREYTFVMKCALYNSGNVRKCLTRCLYSALFAEHSLLPLSRREVKTFRDAELKLQQVWLSTSGARKADDKCEA